MPNADVPLFSLTGARPGPHLLVVGPAELLGSAAAELAKLPSLVYLRGSISLCASSTDFLDQSDADDVLDFGGVDLACDVTELAKPHWVILARATKLGMISGRGIPRHMSMLLELAA